MLKESDISGYNFPYQYDLENKIIIREINIFKIFIPYSKIISDKLIFVLRSLGEID